MTAPARTVFLFSYGTLQDKRVQIANFGRELAGREDALSGYVRRFRAIENPNAAASDGRSHHDNAEPSSDPMDVVSGMVFEVTEQELAVADKYEAAVGYHRVSVTLRTGIQAWIYIHD